MIGIIAAMEQEVSAIVQELSNANTSMISGIEMTQGTLEGNDVIVMKSGVGKGYAAMSTTVLLEHFTIDAIVNIGTAGGLQKTQNILDAVVSTRVVQHDWDTSSLDGEDGRGLFFEADQALAKTCLDVLKELDICVHSGLIASGDLFVARSEDLAHLKQYYPDAICAEMEAGAVAQVCQHYQKPFVILRSLSDIAYKEDSHMDFLTYVTYAAKRSAQFTRAFMKHQS